MSSKRELKLKKIFPDFKEKIIKDYRCSLYLDFHHAGHLILTQTSMYFYSTKNITPPLPNPLGIHSSFKDLTAVEKQGLDGIILKKGEEEIILDGFQFRNETFDALHRSILTAKGKTEKLTESQLKDEPYLPLDIEARTLWNRSIDGLPFLNDLGLLALKYVIVAEDKPVFVGQDTKELTATQRLKKLFFILLQNLDPKLDQDKLASEFDKYFEKAEDQKVKHSDMKPTFVNFLKTHVGGDANSVVKCLRACIHPITGAVIRIKTALTSYFPTKDNKWEVTVNINKESVQVIHLRHEECIRATFQIQWKETLVFDRDLKDLQSVSLFVTDLIFHQDTREPIRYELQNLLKDFLPPAKLPSVDAKNSVLLPSFVDLSNAKLTEIPDFIFEMKNLQTLYLHFNQIESISDKIVNLTNLQVLHLNSNKFSTFPTVVCKLPSLQELHLGSNKITEVPHEIGLLTNLRELSLSYNLLSGSLPMELCSLKNLRRLYLHNNYLESVPKQLADLPLLKILQVHNNQKMTDLWKNFEPGDSEAIIKALKNS